MTILPDGSSAAGTQTNESRKQEILRAFAGLARFLEEWAEHGRYIDYGSIQNFLHISRTPQTPQRLRTTRGRDCGGMRREA